MFIRSISLTDFAVFSLVAVLALAGVGFGTNAIVLAWTLADWLTFYRVGMGVGILFVIFAAFFNYSVV